MTPLEVLTSAQNRIRDPDRWTRNALARGASGRLALPHALEARSWCALGATSATAWRCETADAFLIEAARELFDTTISIVNDQLGHAAVMQMFDRAREIAAFSTGSSSAHGRP